MPVHYYFHSIIPATLGTMLGEGITIMVNTDMISDLKNFTEYKREWKLTVYNERERERVVEGLNQEWLFKKYSLEFPSWRSG